jgi:butyryl-CoA dehydrogenase
VQDPIIRHGTEEQKRKFLTRLATGEWIGCYSLTEADSGSDAGAMRCRAELKGDGWHLTGTKIFVTNGGEANLCLVFCVTDPDNPRRRSSAFMVPMDTPGVQVGKHEDKLGIRGSSTVEIIFNNAVIPEENLLGERGLGLKVAIFAIDGGRLGIASQAIGIAEACLDESAKYAAQRKQFGRPIADFQAVQWKLANMATEIEAARSLTYRGAWLKDQGADFLPYACMAKVFASEAASRAANCAIQVFGGYGYIKDYPVERFLRDAKITELYEGTSEMQRLTIAKCLRDNPEMVQEV